MDNKTHAKNFFLQLQDEICTQVEHFDGIVHLEDQWTREGGGGGKTRIFTGGKFLEKGGVNFSEVYGTLSEEFAKSLPNGEGLNFYATGVSLVLHPKNPFVPTVHANFRCLQRGSALWFGGGSDLTPYYPFREDCIHFHKTYQEALQPFGPDLYPKFKMECDNYFFIKHRNEHRGIGGIFFDYQMGDQSFEIVKACGKAFSKSYFPIVENRIHLPYTKAHKKFQEIRRGRYVEFNLMYDRGTLFGLKTNGRIESILMSLPAKVRWEYNYKVPENSEESKLLAFLQPQDWASMK